MTSRQVHRPRHRGRHLSDRSRSRRSSQASRRTPPNRRTPPSRRTLPSPDIPPRRRIPHTSSTPRRLRTSDQRRGRLHTRRRLDGSRGPHTVTPLRHRRSSAGIPTPQVATRSVTGTGGIGRTESRTTPSAATIPCIPTPRPQQSRPTPRNPAPPALAPSARQRPTAALDEERAGEGGDPTAVAEDRPMPAAAALSSAVAPAATGTTRQAPFRTPPRSSRHRRHTRRRRRTARRRFVTSHLAGGDTGRRAGGAGAVWPQ